MEFERLKLLHSQISDAQGDVVPVLTKLLDLSQRSYGIPLLIETFLLGNLYGERFFLKNCRRRLSFQKALVGLTEATLAQAWKRIFFQFFPHINFLVTIHPFSGCLPFLHSSLPYILSRALLLHSLFFEA